MLAAEQARKMSYSPYSHYKVGAALLTSSGKIYTGCNIENAAYTSTNCAERTAFFKAVSEGERSFSAIAIAGGSNEEASNFCAPCGVCRQVMAEFCDEDFKIISGNTKTYSIVSLAELLPYAFTKDSLDRSQND